MAMQQWQQMAQQAQQQGMQPPPEPMPPEPIDEDAVKAIKKVADIKWAWEDVAGVLRSDYRRCYTVDVETDQSNFTDEEAEKAARTQFFQVVMGSIQQVAPLIAGNPKTGEILKTMVMWVIGAFKSGRAHEEGIERVFDEAIEMAIQQAQQGPAPDPKTQADIETSKARVATAQVGLQTAQVNLAKAQVEAQRAGADIQGEAMSAQMKTQESAAKAQASMVSSQAKAQDAQTKAMQEAQKVEQQAMANEAKRTGHLIDIQNKREKLEFDRETRATAEEALLKGETQKPSGGAS